MQVFCSGTFSQFLLLILLSFYCHPLTIHCPQRENVHQSCKESSPFEISVAGHNSSTTEYRTCQQSAADKCPAKWHPATTKAWRNFQTQATVKERINNSDGAEGSQVGLDAVLCRRTIIPSCHNHHTIFQV